VCTNAAANKERGLRRTGSGAREKCGGRRVRGVVMGRVSGSLTTVHANLEAMRSRTRRGSHTGAMARCSGGDDARARDGGAAGQE
jgi:hypothetical protein